MSSVDDLKAGCGYQLEPTVRCGERCGERRADLRDVVRAVAATVLSRRDGRTLPTVFEQTLRELVPARSIRLREVPSQYRSRLMTPTKTIGSVVLDVPTVNPERQFVLEAIFDPERPLDDWNVEFLAAASLLGTLVLEIDGRRWQTSAAPHVDGAAPLIGSTPSMRALRERVERVAGTDFTTLIEGGMRR